MNSSTDITQKFVEKKYLFENGPADILLHPDHLFNFLNKHELLQYFGKPEQLERAYFRDADESHSDSKSCVIEYPKASVIALAFLLSLSSFYCLLLER